MNIIEMAQKAGFNDGGDCIDIKAFAALVAEHEREACAKISDGVDGYDRFVNQLISKRIRARGNNMTGYKSKRAAAQDKLEQWDNQEFSDWWDSDYDDSTNPYERDSFAYWAWAGWQAALAQPAQERLTNAQIASCIEAADSKWADAEVPVEWARHFAQAIQDAKSAQGSTRKDFEEWAKSLPNYMDITRFENGYSDCNTDHAWAGWQAALAQPGQEKNT